MNHPVHLRVLSNAYNHESGNHVMVMVSIRDGADRNDHFAIEMNHRSYIEPCIEHAKAENRIQNIVNVSVSDNANRIAKQ